MIARNAGLIGIVLTLGAAAAAPAQTTPPERPQVPTPPAPPPFAFHVLPGFDDRQSDAWLGFAYRTEVERTNGSSEVRLIVREVRPQSPAGRAGLAAGDRIVRVNGLAATPDLMRSVSRALEVGDTVRLVVRRDGGERQVTLVAERRPESERRASGDISIIDSEDIVRRARVFLDSALVHLDTLDLPRFRIERRGDDVELHFEEGRFPIRAGRMRVDGDSVVVDADGREIRILRLPDARGIRMHFDTLGTFEMAPGMLFMNRGIVGAEVTELDPQLARHFRGAQEGLLVLRVAEGTPAARAGLQAGDVIVSARGEPVRRRNELQRVITRAGAEPVTLEIVRDGQRRELRLPAPRTERRAREGARQG